MTPEEQTAFLEKVKTQAQEVLDKGKEASKEEITALKTAIDKLKDYDTLKEEHVTLMGKIKSLEEAPKLKASKSVVEQIKSFLTTNATKWEAFKKGEIKNFEIELDLKAATTILESNALGGSAYLPKPEIIGGFIDVVRNRPVPIETFANTSNTSSPVIVWVNKVNPEGTAQFIAEGAVKPLIDFNFETETSTARKVADKIKVSTEMLDDIEFIAAAIENELRYQVDIAVDNALLTGDGIAPNLKGITEYAGAFVLTTIETTNANKSDAIMAAATQIRSLNFVPTHAFVNTIDAANMELQKDSEGRYLLPPFVAANGMTISGLRVVVSNQIAIGSVLVADMSKYVVRNYKSFAITYGWVNDDFEKNLVTVIGERRLHAYMSDNNTGAFVYDTFDNIQTAITLV